MTKKIILLAAAFILAAGGAVAAETTPPAAAAADNQALPAAASPAPAADNQLPAAVDNQVPAAADNQAAVPATPGETPPRSGAKPALSGPRETRPAAKAVRGKPVYISMDFTDVDLPVLIKFMSEQTKKNVIFDERVQGKITVISPKKITVDEAYQVFLSVLQVKGFTVIEQGNTVKIVPLREAKQENLQTDRETPAAAAEFITRLIPLQYADAGEIVPLLTPLVSKDGLVSMFASSNTLLVIDSGANVERILRIIAELDVAGTETTIKVVSLKYAAVSEIVKTLDALFREVGPGGAAAAPATAVAPGGRAVRAPRAGKVRGPAPKFIADARTNSLIILGSRELIADVEELIGKLDIAAPENTGKINVYYLENADAEEMAKVLASLSEKRPGTAAPAVPAGMQPGAARPAAQAGGVIAAELEGGVKVTADKATNSLLIIASLNDYQTLVEVIRKLDIRRRQVYVEALIMEITLNKGRDLGFEYRGAIQTGGNNGGIISGTNFAFQGNVNDLLTALAAGNPLLFSGSGLLFGGIAGNVTLPNGTQIPAITAVLRAAQNSNNVNILSSPHLLTTDNKEAEIVVGQNVPFITSQARDTSTTNLTNVINTIERKDVGVTLRLTPHIHESEYLTLDLYQESSAVVGTSILNADQVGPTTTKRSAKASVLVRNGDTIVLGGMMQETITTTQNQVPLLGDIPLLGWLFKFNSVSRQKTNLLLFLTPHIMRDPADMARITGGQRQKMDRFIDQNKDEVERIIPETNEPPSAVLPPAPGTPGGTPGNPAPAAPSQEGPK